MAELCIKTLIYNSAIENPLLRKKMYFLIIFIPQHVMCIYFIALIGHNLDCPMVAYLNTNSFLIITISAQGKFMIGFFLQFPKIAIIPFWITKYDTYNNKSLFTTNSIRKRKSYTICNFYNIIQKKFFLVAYFLISINTIKQNKNFFGFIYFEEKMDKNS